MYRNRGGNQGGGGRVGVVGLEREIFKISTHSFTEAVVEVVVVDTYDMIHFGCNLYHYLLHLYQPVGKRSDSAYPKDQDFVAIAEVSRVFELGTLY